MGCPTSAELQALTTEAVACSATGDTAGAKGALTAIRDRGPCAVVGACWFLTNATANLCGEGVAPFARQLTDGLWVPVFLDPRTGHTVDPDRPAGAEADVVAAARLSAAVLNDDGDAAAALYMAFDARQRAACLVMLHVEATRAVVDAYRSGHGTPGGE
jgi:hypothetical protein